MAFALTLHAETWTNVTGHAIQAELVARKGDVLTLKRADGSSFKISAKALSEASRLQADKKFPPEKKLSHDERVEKFRKQRLEQLEAARLEKERRKNK